MSAKSEALAKLDRQITKVREDSHDYGGRQIHYYTADFVDWLWRVRNNIAEIKEVGEDQE